MFQITLKMAREACGYTTEEVANHLRVPEYIFNGIEIDSRQIPFSLMQEIARFYHVPFDFIYFGLETECIEHNRKRKRWSNKWVTKLESR